MKKRKKRLSPLEMDMMNVIWNLKKSPSVRDVLKIAYPNGEKAYTTVQTVMNNLVSKGYLDREKIGLVNFYSPLIKKEETLQKETLFFVKKNFGGSFQSLAWFLIDSKSLKPEEIKELKRLIRQKETQENKL